MTMMESKKSKGSNFTESAHNSAKQNFSILAILS